MSMPELLGAEPAIASLNVSIRATAVADGGEDVALMETPSRARFTNRKELPRYDFPSGKMPMKAIIAAYFALVALVCITAIVVLSVHDMKESRLKALDNGYLTGPAH